MASIDLLRIRAFVTAAELGSLSRAANALHLTQPALSKQIRSLEEQLGVQLFERRSGGIHLTSAGRDLLVHGRQLLVQAAHLSQRAQLLQAGATGSLRVGVTAMTLESVLISFLPVYRRRWPDVAVDIVEDGGMRLLRQIEAGELHLAITGPRASHLRFQLLFPVRALAVMRSDHRLSRRRTIELRELVGEPVLLLRTEYTLRQLFDAACLMSSLHPQVVFETSVPSALLAMACIRAGIAVVPSNQLVTEKTLRSLPIVHERKSLAQWLAINWHPQLNLPRYGQAFIDELIAYAADTYPGRQFAYAAPVPRPRD
jgi:DNA-binding transcriptional LysR family regulator